MRGAGSHPTIESLLMRAFAVVLLGLFLAACHSRHWCEKTSDCDPGQTCLIPGNACLQPCATVADCTKYLAEVGECCGGSCAPFVDGGQPVCACMGCD